MGKESTIAPKERINIVYKPASGNSSEQVELPLKMLVVGDYTGRSDEQPLEDRKPIAVDKDNFAEVMRSKDLRLQIQVDDALAPETGDSLNLDLQFKSLKDFEPEGIVQQTEPLRRLLELRASLQALKGPLGNVPAFRKTIEGLLHDATARARLMRELGIAAPTNADEPTSNQEE